VLGVLESCQTHIEFKLVNIKYHVGKGVIFSLFWCFSSLFFSPYI
jgi:hypothetical protein